MSTVTFTIVGKPCGKGRPKFARRGEYVTTYTPEKTVNYESLVKFVWVQSGGEKLHGAIGASFVSHFPIPKSESKKKRAEMDGEWYTKKPDCDNIEKIILDALNGIAYDDDSQVAKQSSEKIYDAEETMVEVTLYELGSRKQSKGGVT